MTGFRDRGVVLSMRVMGGTLGGVWERERRDTLFLLGAIALAVAPQLFNLPLWCAAGFSGLLWSALTSLRDMSFVSPLASAGPSGLDFAAAKSACADD